MPSDRAGLTAAADAILNYWHTVDHPNAGPSWPMIARNTLTALAAEPESVRGWLVEVGLLTYEDVGPRTLLVWELEDDE
jgi:hypothetical protein